MRRFLDQAKGHRLFAFFRLAAFTGARRGELLNLAWSDVDLEGRSVRIRWSASVVDGSSDRGHHQGWPESNGEHRRLDGPGSAGSPGTTGLGSGW